MVAIICVYCVNGRVCDYGSALAVMFIAANNADVGIFRQDLQTDGTTPPALFENVFFPFCRSLLVQENRSAVKQFISRRPRHLSSERTHCSDER